MLFLIVLLLSIQPMQGFMHLSDAKYYAADKKEYIPIENENVLNPQFSAYHESQEPTFFGRYLEKIGIRRPLWSAYIFDRQVAKITEEREKKLPAVVRTLHAQAQDRFIILGPLFGAFHSLLRILTHLKEQGVITNELKIVQPQTFLVFNGNVIDGSPYTMETLSLVMSLMLKNPDHVIYIQGTHEKEQFWLNFELKRELRDRAFFLPHLESLLTRFFKTLPHALDITAGSETVRIANEIEENFNSQNPTIKAVIQAENRLIDYKNHSGLMLTEQEYGVTVWSIFSAQTTLYKEYFNFQYDAYVILTICGSHEIHQSTIDIYQRQSGKIASFTRADSLNIITGQSQLETTHPLIEPVPTNILRFGATMDLTRADKYIGLNIKTGLSAAMHQINHQGGINGKLLRIIVADDESRAILSRENIVGFMQKVSPIIICPVGNHTLAASEDLIRRKKIYVLFTNSGATQFRDPELTHIINFRVSYAVEGEALTDYAAKHLLSKEFAFFCQNDDLGISSLSGAQKALKRLGIAKWTETFYQPNAHDVNDAAETIRKANPDTIGFFSVTSATIALLKKLGAEFLSGKQLLAISPLGDKGFKQFLIEHGMSVTFTQVVPDPEKSELLIAEEYRDYIKKMGLDADTYSFEGYIYGQLAAEFFSKIKGPITMQALAQVIENIKDFNYKGLLLNYSAKDRQLSHTYWIEPTQGQWITQNATQFQG